MLKSVMGFNDVRYFIFGGFVWCSCNWDCLGLNDVYMEFHLSFYLIFRINEIVVYKN